MKNSHPDRVTGKSQGVNTGPGLMSILIVVVLTVLTIVVAGPMDVAPGARTVSPTFFDAAATFFVSISG